MPGEIFNNASQLNFVQSFSKILSSGWENCENNILKILIRLMNGVNKFWKTFEDISGRLWKNLKNHEEILEKL